DDPKGFTANLIKHTAHIVREDLRREGNEVTEAAKVDKTYDAYEEANPDTDGKTGFKQMWASGEIQSYMAEHLGHNPISAHMSMVAEAKASAAEATTQKMITEAVEKAKKEFVTMNRAREVTDGLGGGPGYTPRDGNDELKNTKERGGFVNVVAQKLARSRRNATQ
ncbi:MAG: hypothetical protein U9R40_06140, partial [Synergistota bacterium]|nr:hypothetical protein [Synergistota bacterium]